MRDFYKLWLLVALGVPLLVGILVLLATVHPVLAWIPLWLAGAAIIAACYCDDI